MTTNTFDGAGNLAKSLGPSNQRTTNTWDTENRLTRVTLPSGTVNTFTYNGDVQRVQKQDSIGTTKHIWDGQNIFLETDVNNVIQVTYTLEPALYGDIISQRRSGITSFYLFDGLGSTTQLTNITGSVTDSLVYNSFGEILATFGSAVNPFCYVGRAGYYLDADIAALYLRARCYSPSTGRFLSRDPVQVSDASNWYVYPGNNPIRAIDPSGFDTPMRARPRKAPIPFSRRPPPPTYLGTNWNLVGWGYGWYCGLFRMGPPKNLTPRPGPIDPLDLACQSHDQCLATSRDFWTPEKQIVCNLILCCNAQNAFASGCARAYPTSDPYDILSYFTCRQAAKDVMRFYCGMFGIPNPPKGPPLIPFPITSPHFRSP
jgi:RHS repeat-associated protein